MSDKSMHDRIIAGELATPTLNFCTQLEIEIEVALDTSIYRDLVIEIDGSDMEDLASFSYCSGSIDFDTVTHHADSHEIDLTGEEVSVDIDQSVDGTMEPGDMDGTPAELFDFGVSLLARALEKMHTAAVANGRTLAALSSQRDNMRIANSVVVERYNAAIGEVTKAQGYMNDAKTAVEENRTSDAIDLIHLAMSFLLSVLSVGGTAADVGDQEDEYQKTSDAMDAQTEAMNPTDADQEESG